MELVFATKGIKQNVDRWITMLQGIFMNLPYRVKAEDPMQNGVVQFSLRPIELWSVGFPEGYKDIVCASILGAEGGKLRGNDGEKPVEHTWLNKWLWMIRKALHLDPIGEYKSEVMFPATMAKQDISVVGIGIKKDYIMPNGVEGL